MLTTFALVSVGINTAVNFMGGYIGFMLQPDPTQLCSAYHTKKYSTNNHFIYSVTFVSLFADLIIASGLEIVIIRLWFWSRRKRSWEDNSEGISFSSLVAMYIVNSIALLISIV